MDREKEIEVGELSEKLGQIFYLLVQHNSKIRSLCLSFSDKITNKDDATVFAEILLQELVYSINLSESFIPSFLITDDKSQKTNGSVLTVKVNFPVLVEDFVRTLCHELAYYYVMMGLMANEKYERKVERKV